MLIFKDRRWILHSRGGLDMVAAKTGGILPRGGKESRVRHHQRLGASSQRDTPGAERNRSIYRPKQQLIAVKIARSRKQHHLR